MQPAKARLKGSCGASALLGGFEFELTLRLAKSFARDALTLRDALLVKRSSA
jgi:hypothetical protein